MKIVPTPKVRPKNLTIGGRYKCVARLFCEAWGLRKLQHFYHMTRNDTRRADLLYPMSVDNSLGDFVQKRRREILKKLLTNYFFNNIL